MNESRSIKNSANVNNRKVVMDENTNRSIFKEWKEKKNSGMKEEERKILATSFVPRHKSIHNIIMKGKCGV